MKQYFWILFCIIVAPISVAQTTLDTDSIEVAQQDSLMIVDAFDTLEFSTDPVPESIVSVTPDLLADRLSCIQQDIPLEYNKIVQGFINYYVERNRYYTRLMLYKKNIYFPILEKHLSQFNLPTELKYLAIVESGLNPRARSGASASGLWQFMYMTGRTYGLYKDWYFDDRYDSEKATVAACRYLAELYSMFKDWNLALAAYNCGPNRVRLAIRRSGNKNSFWEIYNFLPRETRSYVPQFIAVYYALSYSKEHNLKEIACEEIIAHDTLNVKGFLHLPTLANLTGGCIEELRWLNPSILHDAIPNGNSFVLKMPIGSKLELEKNRGPILDSASRASRKEVEDMAKKAGGIDGRDLVFYKVKGGDVLGIISQRFHVRVSDIRRWNNLRSNLIRVGQRLKIWRPSSSDSRNLEASLNPKKDSNIQ